MKAKYLGVFHMRGPNQQDLGTKPFQGDNIKYPRTKKSTQVEDIVGFQGLTL